MVLQHHGRIKIYTDVPEITYENVIEVLRKAFNQHRINSSDIQSLINFDSGEQPLERIKKYRPDIDCEDIDNLAHYITEWKLSHIWSEPISLIQRGEKDSGRVNEPLSISMLNEDYETEGIDTKQQELARYIEICGLGYTYSESKRETEYEEGDAYFSLSNLDPRVSFMVYSSYYIDKRKMMGVTYRHDSETGNNYFTCFTKERRFEIENLQKIINGDLVEDKEIWRHGQRSGEINPLGKIPITEWIRNYDRTGAWENQLSELCNLNLLLSDYANSVEQNTQAIWHTNDVDFPTETYTTEDGEEKEIVRKPRSGEWMQTYSTKDGKTPIVETLAINYDYPGMLEHINNARSRILEECFVVERNDNSGGSTGVGMSIATGGDSADRFAKKQNKIMRGCKMEEVEVVLACIKNSLLINPDNQLLALRKRDLQVHIGSQNSKDLTTKVNFFATAVSHGIHGLHAIKAMETFDDPNQVYEDSKATIEAYQNSIISKDNNAVGGDGESQPDADRTIQDLSDQTGNSPFLGGWLNEK